MSIDDPGAGAPSQPTDPDPAPRPPVRRPRRVATPGGAGLPSSALPADIAPLAAADVPPQTPLEASPLPDTAASASVPEAVPSPDPSASPSGWQPAPPGWGAPTPYPGWGPPPQGPPAPAWGQLAQGPQAPQPPLPPGWGQPAQGPRWGQPAQGPGWGQPGQGPGWVQTPPPGWSPAPGTGYPPPQGRGLPLFMGIALFVIIALAVGTAVAIPLALSGNHGSTKTSATPTPNAAAQQAAHVYQQALAAANSSAGYHYVAVSSGDGQSQTIVGDAGQQGGRQVLTFGTEQFTLVLIGSTVYFEGNTPALEDQLGVPASSAAGLTSTWISVSPGDGPYTQLEEGITVDSSMQEIVLDPTSLAQVTTSTGVVTRISGTLPADQGGGTAHLDVSPTTDLPIAYASSSTVDGVTATDTTTFSSWGTAPTVSAPASPTLRAAIARAVAEAAPEVASVCAEVDSAEDRTLHF